LGASFPSSFHPVGAAYPPESAGHPRTPPYNPGYPFEQRSDPLGSPDKVGTAGCYAQNAPVLSAPAAYRHQVRCTQFAQ
jgi:hypothetical protein